MPGPTARGPKRRWDRQKRFRDDLEPFETPPRLPGPALLRGTPRRAHTLDRRLRRRQRMPCPAARSRKEAPFAIARPHLTAPDARVQRARAAWEDTQIAPGYPPGTVSPDRPRVFEIRTDRPRPLAQKPRHIPHPGLSQVGSLLRRGF